MTARPTFGALLGWAAVVILVVGYGVGGKYAPYLLLLLVVISLPYLVAINAGRALAPDWAGVGFIAAFGLLTTCFTLASQAPTDVLIVSNFVWLLLFIPLQSLSRRMAWPRAGVILAMLALAGVVATLGIAVFERISRGDVRVGYITSDAIRIANTAVVLGFLSLSGLLADRGWRRGVYLLGPVMAIAVALLAGTRGAVLSAGVLAVIAGLLLVQRRSLALLAALGIGLTVGVLLFVGLQLHIPRIESLLATIWDVATGNPVEDGSAQIRLAMLHASWGAFWDSPLFGHGLQRIMTAILPYLPPGQESITAGQPHLHNDIADFAVAGGLIGLAAYATILATPVIAAVLSLRDSLYRVRVFAITIVVAAYATLGLNSLMFGFEMHTSLYCGLCAIILGLCRDTSGLAPVPTGLPAARPGPVIEVTAGLLLVLSLVVPTVVGLVTPYVIVIVALGLWLALLLTGRLPTAYAPPAGRVFLIAFAMLLVLFTLTMQSWRDSLFAFNFTMLFLLGPIAWLLSRVSHRWSFDRVSLLASVGVGLTLLMVIYSMLSGVARPTGFNIGPILLSNAALALAVIATAGAFATRNRVGLMLPITLVAAAATTVITQSRGPLIGLLPLLVFTAFMLVRVRPKGWLIMLGTDIIAAAVAVVATLFGSERLAQLPTMAGNLLAGSETGDYTTSIRLALYEAGWKAFLDSPWIGHGWARLMSSALPYLDPHYLEMAARLPQLHNDVLNFAVAGGIVGVGVYLAIITTPTIVALRSVRDALWVVRVYATSGLMIVYLGGGVTDLMFGHEFHTAFYVMLNAIVLSLTSADRSPVAAERA